MALYQGLEVIIDWLEFTVMDTSLKDVIDRILNLPFSDFSPLEKGRLDIRISSNGKQDMCM